jgi:hypothetical protein
MFEELKSNVEELQSKAIVKLTGSKFHQQSQNSCQKTRRRSATKIMVLGNAKTSRRENMSKGSLLELKKKAVEELDRLILEKKTLLREIDQLIG